MTANGLAEEWLGAFLKDSRFHKVSDSRIDQDDKDNCTAGAARLLRMVAEQGVVQRKYKGYT